MRRKNKTLLLAILLLVSALHAADDFAAKADVYLSTMVKTQRFNGSVLVAKDGKVLLSKGYGMANFEWDVPNTPQTKFRLGSITKQFTSMAIMQLEGKGLLKAGDPITKHLTGYPKEAGDRVTIHHLLTHTSGIPSYTSSPDYRKNMMVPYTVPQMIDRFKEKPLEFTPGEKFTYDNSGYFLLGAIIEKVSGKSYEQYLKENIFDPLGMTSSGYDRPRTLLKNRAAGYEYTPDGPVNAEYVDMGQPYAAGSLYSTVEDLYKWDQALYTEKLVSKAALDRIFKPWIPAGGMGSYGYGWGITTVLNRKNVAHGGGINGFNTFISRFPDDHAVVIWLKNVTRGGGPNIQKDLAAMMFGEPVEPFQEKVAVRVDPKVYDGLVGRYELRPGFALTITREGDRLFGEPAGQPKDEIKPLSETRYFPASVDAEIEFVKNDKGQVDGLILHQGGRNQPAKKLP